MTCPDKFSKENTHLNSKSALKEADAAFTSHFRQLGHQEIVVARYSHNYSSL